MGILRETLDFLFPYSCVICGKVSNISFNGCHVCKSCLSSINPQTSDRRWHFCLSEPYSGDKYPDLPLFVPFGYQGEIINLIYGLKFGSKDKNGLLMGTLLGECMRREGITADLVIPIPLSDRRLRQRGYNQADIIASTAAKVCNIPYSKDVLKRIRNTQKQAECKTNEERVENIMGAFSINASWDIQDLRIILVDDVVTTGNTMHEAASVLLNNGAKAVLCCAFASNRAIKNAEDF